MENTQITALPENLSVGGGLYLENTPITALAESGGYRLDRAGERYIAGCRNFTAADALKHWDREDERAVLFSAAIRTEEKRRKKG